MGFILESLRCGFFSRTTNHLLFDEVDRPIITIWYSLLPLTRLTLESYPWEPLWRIFHFAGQLVSKLQKGAWNLRTQWKDIYHPFARDGSGFEDINKCLLHQGNQRVFCLSFHAISVRNLENNRAREPQVKVIDRVWLESAFFQLTTVYDREKQPGSVEVWAKAAVLQSLVDPRLCQLPSEIQYKSALMCGGA